jgi:hypothetical protein
MPYKVAVVLRRDGCPRAERTGHLLPLMFSNLNMPSDFFHSLPS